MLANELLMAMWKTIPSAAPLIGALGEMAAVVPISDARDMVMTWQILRPTEGPTSGTISREVRIDHIATKLAWELSLPAQIDRLMSLRDGWLDGDGKAPPHDGLGWLRETLALRFPGELPMPRLYPTPDGSVQAEWSLAGKETSIIIDLATMAGDWHRLDMTSWTEDARSLELSKPDDWAWLVQEIAEMAESNP